MQEALEEAGLSKNEAEAYIALSRIGRATAYAVAKEANMYKANTYDSLKRLEQENLVTKQEVDGNTLYEAADPSFVLDLLDRKRERVSKILPQLREVQRTVQQKSTMTVYKGADAFVTLLRGMLEHAQPILVWGASRDAYKHLRHRITNFHEQRIKQRIRMLHLYNFDFQDRIQKLKDMPYTDARRLPALYDSTVATNVCGDEVVFLLQDERQLKSIHIRDQDMADAYKKYFELLWQKAQEP